MKKIVGFTLLIILISYLVLLLRYLLIEEVLGLYIFPILLVGVIASFLYGLIRIFIKIRYLDFIISSFIVSCILQVFVISLILWSATSRYFSREQVVHDIDYAILLSEDVHPDFFNSIRKEDFYLKVDSIKRGIPEKVSDDHAYKTIRKIFSLVHDAHTGAVGFHYFFIRKSVLFKKNLPYKFQIKDDRIFVCKNYGYKKNIPIGAEIVSINKKSAAQCLKEVGELISYEIKPYRNAMLQIPYFWSLWNDFRNFEISYISPNSKIIKTIKTSGGLISNFKFISDFESGKLYDFKVIANNIGYIKFNAFHNLENFKIFLESTFKYIKSENINELIIDIRNNTGGSSQLSDEFMQYISNTDFKIFDVGLMKISNELLQKGKLEMVDSSKRISGTLYNFIDTAKTKLRENPLRFNGNIYLLVGGKTFSSAANFASVFQCYNIGKIIGTETGGLTACYYANPYYFELPNLKFKVGVSYKKFSSVCGIDNKRGVIPDYIIENSPGDEEKGIDRVLEFTIDMIKKSK